MKRQYLRTLDLVALLQKKSFFLFGARSTGKTSLIEKNLPKAKFYDLLDNQVYQQLLKRPSIIEEECVGQNYPVIVIDEIQKHPSLLDEVHRLIKKYNFTFLLTGSSARKLKRKGANLLAGRAWQANLFPLTWKEIDALGDFDLLRYLNRGGLPQVYVSDDYKEELESYTATYLREEIQQESVTRNILAFSEFLDIIAIRSGHEINYESLASDCQVSANTIKSYLQILDDTLVGLTLPVYKKTKKKATSRSKHYLFDIGVTNHLCHRGEIKFKSELFGSAFEQFIILEIRAYLSYSRNLRKLSYWRTRDQYEVDILIGDDIAIEIKGTEMVQEKHLKGILMLRKEKIFQQYIVVSLDANARKIDGIDILPWSVFLKNLWQGRY